MNSEISINSKKSQKNRTDLKWAPMEASRRDLLNGMLHEAIRSNQSAHLGKKVISQKIEKITKNHKKIVRT